jgi:glutamine synthetase type III
MVNTVLNSMTAEAFKLVADRIEAGKRARRPRSAVSRPVLSAGIYLCCDECRTRADGETGGGALAGEEAVDVARALLKEHSKVIFNGNGYEPTWPDEAVQKGIWRIDSGVDAICELTSAKNIRMFQDVGVFTEAECHARKSIMLGQYSEWEGIRAGFSCRPSQQRPCPCCSFLRNG